MTNCRQMPQVVELRNNRGKCCAEPKAHLLTVRQNSRKRANNFTEFATGFSIARRKVSSKIPWVLWIRFID